MTYQMLTGQLPFTGSVGQIVFSHLQQPAPDLRLISRETPEYLSAAVMRAMAKQPIDRYQTAGEFAKALMD
jgi:serine/threonine-protein kinase